jgi:hypothetical protein
MRRLLLLVCAQACYQTGRKLGEEEFVDRYISSFSTALSEVDRLGFVIETLMSVKGRL